MDLADEAGALEETRRLLREGHAEILKVPLDKFDALASDAFPSFRRGVVRAEGCREVSAEALLQDLGDKPAVLRFLALLAERKKGYRRQVASVFRILLTGPRWLEAARADPDLLQSLPDSVKAELEELLSDTVKPRDKVDPPAPVVEIERTHECVSDGLELATASFAQLESLGFTAVASAEAVAAFLQFSAGVGGVLRSSQPSELAALAALEPKGQLLHFLCNLHEERRPHRAQVTSLLLGLLGAPSLQVAWRAAVESDPDLQAELESLGVLEPLSPFCQESHDRKFDEFCDGTSSRNSGSECSSPRQHHHTQAASRPTQAPHECKYEARWMWRDAGVFGGILFQGLASLNPVRWSQTRPVADVLAELEEFLDMPAGERPVRIEVFLTKSGTKRIKAATVPEAVTALMDVLSDTNS